MSHTSSMYAKSSEKRTFLTFRHSCAYQGGGKGGGGGGGGEEEMYVTFIVVILCQTINLLQIFWNSKSISFQIDYPQGPYSRGAF